MAANYEVIFREDNGQTGDGTIKWEPGCPLVMDATQISRNTETGEAYLQTKAVNISDKTICEITAEALIRYQNNEVETLTPVELDVSVAPGSTCVFRASKLARGDAERADVRITSIKMTDGEQWTSSAPVSNVILSNMPNLQNKLAAARGSNGAVPTYTAAAPVPNQTYVPVANVNPAMQPQKKGNGKRIAIIIGAILTAIIAAVIVATQLPQCTQLLPGIFNKGVYVVTRETRTDSEGATTVYEYTLDEHGNVMKQSVSGSESYSYTYECDDYGNAIRCFGDDYQYDKDILAVDEYGQPTKMKILSDDGNATTYDIEWYGEGHVKKTIYTYSGEYVIITMTDYFNERGELTRSESLFNYSSGSLSSVLEDSEYYTDFTYTYDSAGRVISRTATNNDGTSSTLEYEYDENGNIVRTTQDGRTVLEIEYTYIEDPSPLVRMKSNHLLGNCGF